MISWDFLSVICQPPSLSYVVVCVQAYESQGWFSSVCRCICEEFSDLCRFHWCCVQSFFSVSRRWLERKVRLSFLLISVEFKKVFWVFLQHRKKESWRTLIEIRKLKGRNFCYTIFLAITIASERFSLQFSNKFLLSFRTNERLACVCLLVTRICQK